MITTTDARCRTVMVALGRRCTLTFLVLWCASMTLRLVLAAYGLENVRP